jgi:hypothetical protein
MDLDCIQVAMGFIGSQQNYWTDYSSPLGHVVCNVNNMWTRRFEIQKVDNGYIVNTYDKDHASEMKIYVTFDEVHSYLMAFFTKEYAQELDQERFI